MVGRLTDDEKGRRCSLSLSLSLYKKTLDVQVYLAKMLLPFVLLPLVDVHVD